MANFYADASALVKQHVWESGSPWIRTLFDPAQSHGIATARVSAVEVVSALARGLREGKLTATDFMTMLAQFRALGQTRYIWSELNDPTIALAQHLLQRHPLRAFDAIHLATALVANASLVAARLPPLTFLAADQRLLTAAQAEGLVTDDPNVHP